MDDPTFAQASLTPRLGGLGLHKVVEHADLAYHASWHEAQKVAKEKWTPPANLPAEYLSQTLLLSSMKRCTNMWLIKLTLAEHSA